METRVRITTPFGSVFKTAPAFLSAELVWPFRDKSTLNVQYPAAGVNSSLFGGECEAVFEYYNGSSWVEPLDSRFRSAGSDRDRLDRTQTRRFDFIALMPSMLESAYVWEGAGLTTDSDGNIVFAAVSPGRILRTLFLNAQARGWGNELSMDFTDTRDSNGALWAGAINLTVDPAQSIYDILSALGNQGVVDWAGQGRTLRVFNPDTTLGRTLADVRLMSAQGETAAPEQVSYRDRATVLRVVGDEGKIWDRSNGSSPWGRLESIMSAGGVNDEGTAYLLSDETLLKSSGARVSKTREFDGSSKFLPHRDYRGGDHVTYQTDAGTESMRVFSMSLTIDASVHGYAVLGDRFEDALITAARKQNAILVGKVNGGNGQQPTQPSGDFRDPEAPLGFIGAASVYMDPAGAEIGIISMSWSHTGKATDGTAIDIDRFEFRIRDSMPGAPWKSFRSVAGEDRNASVSPVATRREDGFAALYDLSIRAVSASSRPSPWVRYNELLMELDTTPPPVPSALIVEDISYAVATLAWDGMGAGDEPMPPDFSHVDGEVGPSPLGPWKKFGAYDRAASQTIPFALPYGSHWARARSFDRAGNASEWSALTEFELRPLVEIPDVHDKIAELETGISDAHTSANGSNRNIRETFPPVVDGKEKVGDLWWQYTFSHKLIGVWMWDGTAYTQYDFGYQIIGEIDAGVITVGFLHGSRIEAKTLSLQTLIAGDFTNLAQVDASWGVNVSVPASCETVSTDGWTRKAAGGDNILLFMDQAGPVPVESGDTIRVSFRGMSDQPTTVSCSLWVYPNTDTPFGAKSATMAALSFGAPQDYTFDIEVPNLSTIGGGKSWAVGLTGAGIRYIGVQNVRVYKKTGATLIDKGSIMTEHLQSKIIEGKHIKGNTIEGDNLKFGFADGKVITGALIQTMATAQYGIKIDGGTNSMSAWNVTNNRVFYLNGDNGDVVLGRNEAIRLFGSTGSVNIGNGKLTINGANGDLTIGASQVFKVNGTNGNLDIGNGKMTVNGSTGAIVVANASITGATIIGGRIEMIGTSSGIGYDIKQYVDQYGMAVTQFWTPNSDTPGTIRVHQDGTELNPGDEYDPGPPFRTGGTQMVIRAPRRTGFTENRAVLFLQSWVVNEGPYNQPRVVNRGDFYLTGTGAYTGDAGVLVDSASTYTLDIGMYAGAVRSTVIRDRAYTGAANVFVTENGFLGQTSSASRFKLDQQVMDLPDSLLDIPVKDWIDRTTHDELDELLTSGVRTFDQQRLVNNGFGMKRVPGVVAEDVAHSDGGEQFVTYSSEGEIQGVAYDRLAIAQIAVLNRQLKAERERNDNLESRLATLEKTRGKL